MVRTLLPVGLALVLLDLGCVSRPTCEPWRPAPAAISPTASASDGDAESAIPAGSAEAPDPASPHTVTIEPTLVAAPAAARSPENHEAPSTTKPSPPPAPRAKPRSADRGASKQAMAEARQIYGTRCTACHGPKGDGEGPAGRSLTPKPRNFTDKAWHKTISNRQIEQTIIKGGAAMGKSPLMPPSPDLADKPAVVAALRRMVRSFGH